MRGRMVSWKARLPHARCCGWLVLIQAIILVWLSGATVPLAAPAGASEQPRRVVGYYVSWSAYKNLFPDDIAADDLTHLVYAFANISDKGTVILGDPCIDAGQCGRAGHSGPAGGNFTRLQKLKERHPRLKVLAAIGGWTWSKRFSDAARTQQTRERFVRSAIELLLDTWPGLFDGFDLDWEYPVGGGDAKNVYRAEDKKNYTRLIAEFRRQLDRRATEYQRPFLLTVAAPAELETMANIEIDQIQSHVDWLNVMTYDYHTGISVTYFNAPLYAASGDPRPSSNVHTTIQAYLSSGIPPEKLVLGIPFFGSKYRGVTANRDGLFQRARAGEYILFRDLQKQAASGYRRFWHGDSQVPWLYNQQSGTWLTYDDVESVAAKSEYAKQHALGGVMIWEVGGDDGSLLKTIARSLNK
jgi:chitinase